jgi:hypothetical protein
VSDQPIDGCRLSGIQRVVINNGDRELVVFDYRGREVARLKPGERFLPVQPTEGDAT